jgi:hypothetical protein
MPDPTRPPTLGQLLAQGIVEAASSILTGLVALGDQTQLYDLAQDVLTSLTPALLPSTYAALLKRAIASVDAIWSEQPAERPQPVPLSQIPIQPERKGRAGDYTGRILYRVVLFVPMGEGVFEPRTQYVDSSIPLSYQQVIDLAVAGYEALVGEPYGPPPPGGTTPTEIKIGQIKAITRSH